jgi:chorismate-pyruvate lyase
MRMNVIEIACPFSKFPCSFKIDKSFSHESNGLEEAGLCDRTFEMLANFPQFELLSPLERILVTTNGNLQRVLSAFYNSEVSVSIQSFQQRNYENEKTNHEIFVYDREVTLHCFGQEICIAKSVVAISDPHIRDLIESQKVGIGQLYRALGILPWFELVDLGKDDQQRMFRVYNLKTNGFTSHIHEDFSANILKLHDSK